MAHPLMANMAVPLYTVCNQIYYEGNGDAPPCYVSACGNFAIGVCSVCHEAVCPFHSKVASGFRACLKDLEDIRRSREQADKEEKQRRRKELLTPAQPLNRLNTLHRRDVRALLSQTEWLTERDKAIQAAGGMKNVLLQLAADVCAVFPSETVNVPAPRPESLGARVAGAIWGRRTREIVVHRVRGSSYAVAEDLTWWDYGGASWIPSAPTLEVLVPLVAKVRSGGKPRRSRKPRT